MKRSLKRSFQDAFTGLWFCLGTQRNMVIHVTAGLLAIGLGFFLQVTVLEKLILLIVIFFVIILEVVNTAIEKAVDTATRDYDRNAYYAKVVAASAVLLAVFLAVITGLVILAPPLYRLVW